MAWLRPHSRIGTAAPVTPICTPTSPSPIRSKPLTGRWLSIDGRVLFKAAVAASETYNTALEHHLRDQLGIRFAERSDGDPRKPAVREIVGVDEELMSAGRLDGR